MRIFFITLVSLACIFSDIFAGTLITPTYDVFVIDELRDSTKVGVEVICDFEKYVFIQRTYDWTRKTYTTDVQASTQLNVLSVSLFLYSDTCVLFHQCNPKRRRAWYQLNDRYFCEHFMLEFELSDLKGVMREQAKLFLDNPRECYARDVIYRNLSGKIDLNVRKVEK